MLKSHTYFKDNKRDQSHIMILTENYLLPAYKSTNFISAVKIT